MFHSKIQYLCTSLFRSSLVLIILKPFVALSEYQIARVLYGLDMIELKFGIDFFNYTKDKTYKKQRAIENSNFDEIKSRFMPISFDSVKQIKETKLDFNDIKTIDCNSLQPIVTDTNSGSAAHKVPQSHPSIIETPIKALHTDLNRNLNHDV